MDESVGVGLNDLQLNGFVVHFANFRDQFVVIGGCVRVMSCLRMRRCRFA